LSDSKIVENEKEFNIEGPCDPKRHYMIPALERQTEVLQRIKSKRYFILHAPRQSGKTTFLDAIINKINKEGQYYALYCSLNSLTDIKDKETMAEGVVELLRSASEEVKNIADAWPSTKKWLPNIYVRKVLSDLCATLDKPLVLFFDETDSLTGDPLITFLTQLRDGFNRRTKIPFPSSIALVGMSQIRDYITNFSSEKESLNSPSPFNIASALTLNNFTRDEIGLLYAQHTKAPGQVFEPDSVERAWYWTCGQPWLLMPWLSKWSNRI
jgi:hypothetical protein